MANIGAWALKQCRGPSRSAVKYLFLGQQLVLFRVLWLCVYCLFSQRKERASCDCARSQPLLDASLVPWKEAELPHLPGHAAEGAILTCAGMGRFTGWWERFMARTNGEPRRERRAAANHTCAVHPTLGTQACACPPYCAALVLCG